MRGAFLSKLIYKTYNGSVLSQSKKLEQDLRAKGEIKQKHDWRFTTAAARIKPKPLYPTILP